MKKFKIFIGLIFVPIIAAANIYSDLQPDEPDAGGMSDWLLYLVTIFVVLMVAGKIK